MLMTVLHGELAIKQSRALVKTFKKMKDYILENRDLIGQREILQLSMVQIPLHRITDSASNGSVFPVVTEHFSASSDHAFL